MNVSNSFRRSSFTTVHQLTFTPNTKSILFFFCFLDWLKVVKMIDWVAMTVAILEYSELEQWFRYCAMNGFIIVLKMKHDQNQILSINVQWECKVFILGNLLYYFMFGIIFFALNENEVKRSIKRFSLHSHNTTSYYLFISTWNVPLTERALSFRALFIRIYISINPTTESFVLMPK